MHRTRHKTDWGVVVGRATGILVLLAGILFAAGLCAATPQDNAVPSIFDPHSTPADSIRHLSHFVLAVTGLIFLVVFSLLSYVVVKFPSRPGAPPPDPPPVYGRPQIDLS